MKIGKSQFFGTLAFILWVPIPWFYLDPPGFLAGQPLAIYAVTLFFAGLSTAAVALLISLRRRVSERAARVYIFLFVLAFVGAYQFSGLAPSWQCFGKKLQAAVGRAAGQNCTETCTNNKKKPCSGWSSCWDKFVSCSATGRDQDGRGCQGCCFSCTVVCEDPDPEPPSAQPPTISASVACSQNGNNGWCTGTSTLNLTASDPQNYTLTISGTIASTPFTCAAGNTCSMALPEGNGSITYKATAATSGLSSVTGSTTWKRDGTSPSVNPVYPSVNGSNSWHVISPVVASATGADTVSGLNAAEIAVNGGGWQSTASLSDGIYTVDFRAFDNAGNSVTITRTIKVDATAPTVSPIIPTPDGLNGWFITAPVDVSVSGSDAGSGLAATLVSVDGATWQPGLSLQDGIHTAQFRSVDNAGNATVVNRSIKVDASIPAILTSIAGTEGNFGWYTSPTTAVISATELSGIDHVEYNQNGTGWENGTSIESSDGINTIDLKVYDIAGNVATKTIVIKIDTVAPTITSSTTGTKRLSDWYVSRAVTDIAAEDETSGVDRIEHSQNSAEWLTGASVVSEDGINMIGVRVYDVAGNMAEESLTVKVDTIAPIVSPIIPWPDGLNNWFVTAPVNISVNGSDSGSGVASTEVAVKDANWQPSASLRDGVHSVQFRATDNAGNTGTVIRNIQVDTTAPTLSTSISGKRGSAGWFISETNTIITATDETSGVDKVQYNQNDLDWRDGASVTSKDGINSILFKAYDLAGNTAADSLEIKIDTERPTSEFTSPANGSTNTLVRGSYSLSGASSDTISGVAAVELSLDNKTWLPLQVAHGNTWAYDWDTSHWPDGVYPIIIRTTDIAGNTELVDSGATATLLVNNAPPHIKLTPEWFIWQSGYLVIKTEYFPVKDGTVVIADPQGRWPKIEIPFGEKYPAEIRWDRRFANGILAPTGDYRVTVSACNIYDLCAQKTAAIKIPWYAVVLPTSAAPTQLAEVEPETPDIKEPSATAVAPALELPVAAPEPARDVVPGHELNLALLATIVIVALMWAISSAALADKRPIAIRAIAQTLNSQQHNKGESKYE